MSTPNHWERTESTPEKKPIPEEFLKSVIEEARETTPSFFFNEISAKNAAVAAYRHLSSQQKAAPEMREAFIRDSLDAAHKYAPLHQNIRTYFRAGAEWAYEFSKSLHQQSEEPPLQPIEGEQKSELMKMWEEGKIPDFSHLPPNDRFDFIDGFVNVVGYEFLKAFMALRLKDGIETKVINQSNGETFILSFKKQTEAKLIADHIHVKLPSGGIATVKPDASPELLGALNTMIEKAMEMPIADKEVPEKMQEWMTAQCAEDVPEIFRISKARYAFEQGHKKGCSSMYKKMQEIVAMHMEVIDAAVSTTDKVRAELSIAQKEYDRQTSLKESCLATIEDQRKAGLAANIRISTDGEQIAALLSALKERGEMYLAVEKELLAARDRLKRIAVARSAFESTGIARTHLAEYPSST